MTLIVVQTWRWPRAPKSLSPISRLPVFDAVSWFVEWKG